MSAQANTSTSFHFYEKIYLQIIALLSIIALLYFATINFQLTQYDDSFFTEASENWLQHSKHFSDAFTKSVFGSDASKSDSYYRPILLVSFYLDEWIGQGSLKTYHITNLLLHAVNVLLLLFLFRKLKFKSNISFWFALFFAIHPALVQAIAWIPGRNDSLLTLFALASLLLLIDHLRTNSFPLLLLQLLFFELALLTKETAVLLPVLYLFLWYSMSNETDKSRKFPWLQTASWLMFIVAFFIVRTSVIGSANELPLAYSLENFLANLPALLIYTGKMLLPFNLSTFPILSDSTLLFGILTLIATIVVVYFTKGKNKMMIALASFWWILFLLPAILRTSSDYESVFLEHRIYFPLIGFLLLWAQTSVVNKSIGSESISYIVNPSLTILFGALAFFHRENYRDEEHYWSSAVQHSPDASYARRALGNYYFFMHQPEQAQLQYAMALQLNPNLPEVRNNLGRIAMNRGDFKIAEEYLKQEILLHPDSYMTYYNLGLVKMNQKVFDSAEFYVRKSILMNPDYMDSQNDLAVIMAMEGKFEDALKQSIQLLEENPDYYPAKKNLKLILSIWNDSQKVNYYQGLLRQKGITY